MGKPRFIVTDALVWGREAHLNVHVCPLRPSYKTVDSYHIGKLRAIFQAVGRNGEWDRRLGLGNPAGDKGLSPFSYG